MMMLVFIGVQDKDETDQCEYVLIKKIKNNFPTPK